MSILSNTIMSVMSNQAEALLGPFVKFDYGEAVLFDERDSAAGDGTGGFGKKASKSKKKKKR